MRTDFRNVLVEQDESVAMLTMNLPDVLNVINTLMLEELTEAVEAAGKWTHSHISVHQRAHVYVIGYGPASLPPSRATIT